MNVNDRNASNTEEKLQHTQKNFKIVPYYNNLLVGPQWYQLFCVALFIKS